MCLVCRAQKLRQLAEDEKRENLMRTEFLQRVTDGPMYESPAINFAAAMTADLPDEGPIPFNAANQK